MDTVAANYALLSGECTRAFCDSTAQRSRVCMETMQFLQSMEGVLKTIDKRIEEMYSLALLVSRSTLLCADSEFLHGIFADFAMEIDTCARSARKIPATSANVETFDLTLKGFSLNNVRIDSNDHAKKSLSTLAQSVERKNAICKYYADIHSDVELAIAQLQEHVGLRSVQAKLTDTEIATQMTNFVCRQVLTEN